MVTELYVQQDYTPHPQKKTTHKKQKNWNSEQSTFISFHILRIKVISTA